MNAKRITPTLWLDLSTANLSKDARHLRAFLEAFAVPASPDLANDCEAIAQGLPLSTCGWLVMPNGQPLKFSAIAGIMGLTADELANAIAELREAGLALLLTLSSGAGVIGVPGWLDRQVGRTRQPRKDKPKPRAESEAA